MMKFDYDSNHRLIKKYDFHNGVVNTSNTPFLAYTYDDTATNGIMQNAGRLTGVDYFGGKHIEYSYNSPNSIDDLLNRLNAIIVDSLTVANYDYSGNNRLMEVILPEPDTGLTYQNGGLDRYGWIVNHSWIEDNQPLVHIIHGYDYTGNRTHRYDAVYSASSELYSYDAVNQIKSLQRGILDNDFETVTNLTFSESWNFDKTGNWLEYGKNGTTQTRTVNTANQILSINGNTNQIAHDANGNMFKVPKPDESGNHFIFKYDAWNRVTAVYESDSSTKVAEYFYNGLGHRITKKTYANGILSETRNYFYNENWQCIEERVGVTVDRTYVWGPRGIDDLVMRERGEERLYPLTDPNNNVVAIIDSTGEVKERYRYDAFGKVTYLNPDFSVRTTSQYDWDFLFTSRRLDKETGLMYYRNRYYHPVIGRFTTVDPLGYDADDVNLYRYVNNQPEIMIDPMGLEQQEEDDPIRILLNSQPDLSGRNGGTSSTSDNSQCPQPLLPITDSLYGPDDPSKNIFVNNQTNPDTGDPNLDAQLQNMNNSNSSTGNPFLDKLLQQGINQGLNQLKKQDTSWGYWNSTRPFTSDWPSMGKPPGRLIFTDPLKTDWYIDMRGKINGENWGIGIEIRGVPKPGKEIPKPDEGRLRK